MQIDFLMHNSGLTFCVCVVCTGFDVFPNPVSAARGFIEIVFTDNSQNSVEIFSMNGVKILEKSLQKVEVLDISQLSPSNYIIKSKKGSSILLVY
jgi:hypothetical protein